MSWDSKQEGAFNLRHNGMAMCHGDSEHVKIVRKEDKPGIDVYVDGDADGEEVHIPVVVDASGFTDKVYNDFHIADGANVVIIAGCGIHNDGHEASQHDGVHAFHVGKGANVTYKENHYGEGSGDGARILNPVTEIYMDDDSVFTLDTSQIKGVDSTKRETQVDMGKNAKLFVVEKLMTHGDQIAESNMEVRLNGAGSFGPDCVQIGGKGKVKPDIPSGRGGQQQVQCSHTVRFHHHGRGPGPLYT